MENVSKIDPSSSQEENQPKKTPGYCGWHCPVTGSPCTEPGCIGAVCVKTPSKTIPLSDKEITRWEAALDAIPGALAPDITDLVRRLLATARQFNAQSKLIPSGMTPEELALKDAIENESPMPPSEETLNTMHALCMLTPRGGSVRITRHGLLCLISAGRILNTYFNAGREL